ncbi:MAG: hypothetical protein ACK44A_10530 [Roseateles sp.]
MQHYYQLRELGVQHIERETFDAARRQAMRLRQHNIEVLERMAQLRGDEKALIAAAKLGRQQFEELLAAEREADDAHRRAQQHGWDRQG